ncbi:MAG: alanyl-tRNA editing protein, partial [Candidatus Eisenbacteria bacterium]
HDTVAQDAQVPAGAPHVLMDHGSSASGDRPYFDDPYTTAFTATVTRERTDARGRWLALERSWFYPTGGGQECDLGTLGAAAVIDVEEDAAGDVWHLLGAAAGGPGGPAMPTVGESVPATIDAGRRQGNRQQHTGQHVLSQAFERVLGAETLSSRLGEFEGTIDLDRADLSWDDVARVEDAANAVVFDDRPVTSIVVAPADLAAYPLRKPPKVHGPVRLIVVPDWDASPCGGTHCTRTGEIGSIKVRRWEKWRGGVRVEFVCGVRALADHQDRVRAMVEAALRRNTADHDVIAQLERAADERVALARQLKRLGEQLAEAEAAAWGASAAAGAGWARLLDERDAAAVKSLAVAALRRGAPLVVVAARAPEPVLVVARPRDRKEPDVRALAPDLLAAGAGRGGGGPDLFSMVAADGERLLAAYALARERTGAREES